MQSLDGEALREPLRSQRVQAALSAKARHAAHEIARAIAVLRGNATEGQISQTVSAETRV